MKIIKFGRLGRSYGHENSVLRFLFIRSSGFGLMYPTLTALWCIVTQQPAFGCLQYPRLAKLNIFGYHLNILQVEGFGRTPVVGNLFRLLGITGLWNSEK